MPVPEPIITGTNVLITEKRNLGYQGWSENYIMNVGDTAQPLERALELHKTLLNARQAVSPSAVQLLSVTASEVVVGNDSIAKSGGEMFTGPGKKAGVPADPDIGWMVRFQDVSGQVRDMHMWKGWIGTDVPYNDAVITGTVPNTVRTFLQQAINLMRQQVTADAGANGRYVIKSFARPGVMGVVLMNAFSFTLTADRKVKFRVVNAGGADVDPGDVMKVHVRRKRCVRGLSGEAVVIAVENVADDIYDITLDKTFCCSASDLVGITGQAILKKVAFYAINSGTINRMRKRKCGRPFGSIPGRRSARCC